MDNIFIDIFAESKNQDWLGSIDSLKYIEILPNSITVKIAVKEYTVEGIFGEFDESKKVVINKNADLTKWTIFLDGISPGQLKDLKEEYEKQKMLFCRSLFITEKQGSFNDPSFTQSKEGRLVTTSKIVFKGQEPIYITLEKVNKNDLSFVRIFLKITNIIPPQLGIVNHCSKLEVSVDDFVEKQRPVGNFLSKIDDRNLLPKTRAYLEQLRKMSEQTYVTLIYQAQYCDVNLLKSKLDILKSGVGNVEVLEPNAQIIIRDRAEYVLEMLYLLFAIDIPVPQVAIDVQIIERNIQKGEDFSSSFGAKINHTNHNYDTGFNSPENGIKSSLEDKHFSGIYTNLEKDLLNQFQFSINREIRRGKATIKASTRIICKNREIAQFNSGNKIPYYKFSEYNVTQNSADYDSSDKTRSGVENKDDDITFSDRGYKYKENKNDRQKKWQLDFINTGVNLWIKPYIKNSEWIELQLKPSYSEITDMRTVSNIPVLSDRSLDISVTVKNGDTFLLAGLLYEKEIKVLKGVPVLMDIPLIGGLFSSSSKQKEQTEIIFVLTVNIKYPNIER